MRGGPRPGSGRKKGTKNSLQKAQAIPVKWVGETPAEYFARVMHDPTISAERRDDMAKAAAPYVHMKQPQAQEIRAKIDIPPPLIFLARGSEADDD